MVKSDLEAWLYRDIRAVGLPEPESEFMFHPTRKWRSDFAWPQQKVLVEVEGGSWVKGRHSRAYGFEADCRKYNAATELGWKLYRFTGSMIKSGEAIAFLERNIKK